ncbi:MAG TPA: helix-turn-helix transcriptional regulator [Micromonosporaceae bacterium]|nr:helix-turn-helix transcriptional regulator [Micromonosporaceae bacterium]
MSSSPHRLTEGQRRALVDFLRTRRARLTPADVGLPAGGGRRTAGLRREEVAVLAGVSVTWYTWLEQGRPINPSDAVLRAIARTLRLTDDETSHLLKLAVPGPATNGWTEPPPELQALVDSQHPAPAVLLDPRWDLLGWNRSAEALWTFSAVPPADRNLAWLTFHPVLRTVLVDWEGHARRVVGELRASSAALADDPRFAAVLARLRATYPEVEAWWSTGEVRTPTGSRKVIDHPEVGRLVMDQVVLRPASAPDLHLSVLVPERGGDTADRLTALLAAAHR